jgi:hypothetical protein
MCEHDGTVTTDVVRLIKTYSGQTVTLPFKNMQLECWNDVCMLMALNINYEHQDTSLL